MDVCCLNRPFDGLEQERIRLEADAVLGIFQRCQTGEWNLVNSDAIEFELENTPNREKAEQVASLLALAQTKIAYTETIDHRASVLIPLGFKFYDALHIAFAESAQATVMLTTDDRLLRKALNYQNTLSIAVSNPVTWLMTVIQSEGDANHDTH